MSVRINQAEIARVTGVPRSTVSYALNPRLRSKLRPEIRRRIMETAEQLGYRPDLYAQVMRKGRSGIIGVVNYLGLLQVEMERVYHVSRSVRAAGYRLNTESLTSPDDCSSACTSLIDARVEGLVFGTVCDRFDESEVARMRAAHIPVVMLGAHRCPGVPLVGADVRQGFRELTKHVLELGHRHLVFVASRDPQRCDEYLHWMALERYRGFEDAVTAAGGRVFLAAGDTRTRVDGVVGEVIVEELPGSFVEWFEPGQAAMRKLLQRDALPDAVLCSNDDWAVGAIAACAAAGVRVPEDLAITGFDNTSIGQVCRVPLTTVAQPTRASAETAVEILLRQIQGEKIPVSEQLVKLPCRLVVRESCGGRKHATNGSADTVDHGREN